MRRRLKRAANPKRNRKLEAIRRQRILDAFEAGKNHVDPITWGRAYTEGKIAFLNEVTLILIEEFGLDEATRIANLIDSKINLTS